MYPNDLTGFLLEQEDWTHLSLPAIAPRDQQIPISEGKNHFWSKGVVLEATCQTFDELRKVRAIGSVQFNMPTPTKKRRVR